MVYPSLVGLLPAAGTLVGRQGEGPLQCPVRCPWRRSPDVRHVPNPGEDVEEGDDFAGVVAALVAETQQSEIRENSFAPPEGFEPSHTV